MSDHHRISIAVNPSPFRDEMSVLFCGEGEPRGGHAIGPAVHDYYLIHIVLDGGGVFETLGERHRLKAGDCFVIFPEVLVRYEADKQHPWSYMWVAFSGGASDDMLSRIGFAPDAGIVRGCDLAEMEELFRKLRVSLEQPEGGSAGLRSVEASGWLRIMLFKLGQLAISAADGEPPFGKREGIKEEAGELHSRAFPGLQQAISMLSYQYGQHTSVNEIAKALGYHRAHLTKLFKETTGLSPMQYLYKVRMKKAETLLMNGLTVAQTAASVGFNDPLFFTKQFRKWSGVTPTEFKRAGDARPSGEEADQPEAQSSAMEAGPPGPESAP
ncbi:AraC family transcriptional regulator [Paenibacillus sp. CAU 1782]